MIEFLELNSNAMFQVALLLSADIYTAKTHCSTASMNLPSGEHADKDISTPGNMLSLRGALQSVRLKHPV